MAPPLFATVPHRIQRRDVIMMGQSTVDDLPHIRSLWPRFEQLVGVRGRKMYARVDLDRGTYTVCTPVRPGDDPEVFGLELGALPGGAYLRGRLKGEPEVIYAAIGAGMQHLRAMESPDTSRPLVEFYRRRNEVELWVPVLA